MTARLSITRHDRSSADLRATGRRCRDGRQGQRLLALALVLDGRSRSEAATFAGVTAQTLRDWVERYNVMGVDGLKSRPPPGRPPALSDTQKAALRVLVERGPDPAMRRAAAWRLHELRDEVARSFAVEVHPNTIGRWLHDLDLQKFMSRRSMSQPFDRRGGARASSLAALDARSPDAGAACAGGRDATAG